MGPGRVSGRMHVCSGVPSVGHGSADAASWRRTMGWRVGRAAVGHRSSSAVVTGMVPVPWVGWVPSGSWVTVRGHHCV